MRQLAGTKTRYRRAHATPLARLISGRAECTSSVCTPVESHSGARLRGVAYSFCYCGMQVKDSILQAIELLHFFVAQHAVEHGKIIHVSDV